jgi:cell fate regulator YaaT (PSP1 superfamily)
MGCGNCSTGTGGKPGGCKDNGGCSTGGCNRLNVYDWLNALPLHDGAKPYAVIEVSFNKGSRKEFFRNNTNYILEKNEWITVEGTGGVDVGQVSLTGELVKLQLKKYGVRENDVTKRVLHPSTDEELEVYGKNKDREPDTLTRSRAIARSLDLDMKLCEVEIQADGRKGTFFYTADQRVDFRELIRVFATDFKLKVEMRQIGARQESGKVGGIGSCGRELCCSTWLTDFKSVNTTAARYQNLSINQTKLSGQCGRLKCCLNYELDTYMDALSEFPNNADSLETVTGIAHLQKRDIFKNVMWYSFHGNNKQYPLSITRVKEILALNKEGKKADDLQPVELETRDARGTIKVVDMGYVNDVGQITLKALEKNTSKKKKKKPSANSAKPQKPATAGDPVEGAPQAARPANKPQQQGNKPPQQQGNKQQPKQGQPRPNNNPNAAIEGGAPAPERPPKPQGQGGQQGGKPQQQRRPNPNQGQPAAEGDRPPQQQRKPNPNANQAQPAADGEKPQQQPRPQQQGGKQGGNRQQQQKRPNQQQGGTPRSEQPKPPKQNEGDTPKPE